MPLASPPRPSFRHAFACLPQARSRRWSGCSPGASGPRAARRFLQRCGSPSTTTDSPNPEARSDGRSHRACRWTYALAGQIQPDRPRSGVARRDDLLLARRERDHERGLTTPVPASAAPTRIYPNLISTRAPPVACWYLPLPEVGIGWRPRGASPRDACWDATSTPHVEGQLAGSPSTRPGELGGPLPPDTRESIRAQPHPRCLSPTKPVAFRLRRELWILAAGLVTRTARVPLHLLFPVEVGTLDEV